MSVRKPTDVPLVGYEYHHTFKQFFEAHPEIPIEPLLERLYVECPECEDVRQCDHQIDPIIILEWSLGYFDPKFRGEYLLDIYSEPSHIHQIGYVYYNNWPAIENVNMDLTIIADTTLQSCASEICPRCTVDYFTNHFDMKAFLSLRLAAFGYISKNVKLVDDTHRDIRVRFEDYESEIPEDLRNINEQMKRFMQHTTTVSKND